MFEIKENHIKDFGWAGAESESLIHPVTTFGLAKKDNKKTYSLDQGLTCGDWSRIFWKLSGLKINEIKGGQSL
jgi:hypothetical protein